MSYPTNNIYTLHHNNLAVLQINDDTRIVTAYFDLQPADINRFSLDQKIYIDGLKYIVNRVIDYNANGRNLTKVELVTFNTQ